MEAGSGRASPSHRERVLGLGTIGCMGWLHFGRVGARSLHFGRVGVSRVKSRKSSTNLKFLKF